MKIKQLILEIAGILFLSVVSGLIFNALSANGISLLYHTPQINNRDNISAEQAYKLYNEGRALFIDARYREEYVQKRIEKSINLPASYSIDQISTHLDDYDKEQIIVVYCSAPSCTYSTRVAGICRFLKYSNVFVFGGGIEDWETNGYPLLIPDE